MENEIRLKSMEQNRILSKRTLLELIRVIETFTQNEIDRIYIVFGWHQIITKFGTPAPTKSQKTTQIYSHLTKDERSNGPFSESIELDLLQYVVDEFFRNNSAFGIPGYREYNFDGPPISHENAFNQYHKSLANLLRLDGFTVEKKMVKKLLPAQIAESRLETELEFNLKRFSFTRSEGHLIQAISNYTQGNWAGANSQFRTFIESLLVELCSKLLPENPARTAAQAITLLSQTVNPPFLNRELNEVPKEKGTDSFVYGLWVRLHPEGSHPGLSDEEDCTFRYHISIVFANYLLNRLAKRSNLHE